MFATHDSRAAHQSMNRAVPHRPIVIVGAARSGTTMIREALGRHPDVVAAPYELNYLWRYGNRSLPHDCLLPEEHLSPRIQQYIANRLERIRSQAGDGRLLDKTVANVVRLRYIREVLPSATFIHIIRDGRAVAASAMKKWGAPQAPTYYLSKARYIPPRDLPIYAWRYLRGLVHRKFRGEQRKGTWGVRFRGIDTIVANTSLARVCAMQWRVSVETAIEQAKHLRKGSYLEVRYEEVVKNPVAVFGAMQQFLELAPAAQVEDWVSATSNPNRQYRWKDQLGPDELEEINVEAAPLLRRLGYL